MMALCIMIRGDMNAHTKENGFAVRMKNGRSRKESMNKTGLQIFEIVSGMVRVKLSGSQSRRSFTLDYVCMDGRGMRKAMSASGLDRGEVI